MESKVDVFALLKSEGISEHAFRRILIEDLKSKVEQAVAEFGDMIPSDYDDSLPMFRQPAPGPTKGGILELSFERDQEEPSWTHSFICKDEWGYYYQKEYCDCGQYTATEELRQLDNMMLPNLVRVIPPAMLSDLLREKRLQLHGIEVLDTGYNGVLIGTIDGVPHYTPMKAQDYSRYLQLQGNERDDFILGIAFSEEYLGQHNEERVAKECSFHR